MPSNLRAVGSIVTINIAGGIIAILNSVAQARIFGVSKEIEVFFVILTVNQALLKLTQSGAFSAVFLPIYLKIKDQEGSRAAQISFSVMLNWFILYTILVVLVIALLAHFLVPAIMPAFSEKDIQLGLSMYFFIIPFLPFQVMNSLLKVPLNAEKIYGRAEMIGISNRIFAVIFLLVTYNTLGIWAMVYSLGLGYLFQFFFFVMLYRKIRFVYRLWFSFGNLRPAQIFKKLASTLGYAFSTQIYTLVFTASLSYLPSGSIAIYKYVSNIFGKINGILLRPVTTVFFTNFVGALHDKKSRNLTTILNNAIVQNLIICSFVSVLCVLAGESALSLLWQNEKFGGEFITKAYSLLTYFFIFMLFSAAGQIYSRVNLSFEWVERQYIGASVVQLISAVISVLAITNLGFFGLALTIGLNMFLLFFNPFSIIWLRKRQLLTPFPFGELAKLAIIVVVAIALLYPANSLVLDNQVLNAVFTKIIVVIFQISAGSVLFVLLGYFFKLHHISFIFKLKVLNGLKTYFAKKQF